MVNTGFKSFNEPMPVLYKVSRRLQEKTQVSETKVKVIKTVRQNVRNPPQNAILHIIVQKKENQSYINFTRYSIGPEGL